MFKVMYLASRSGWHVYYAGNDADEADRVARQLIEKARNSEIYEAPAFEGVKILRVSVVQEMMAEEI